MTKSLREEIEKSLLSIIKDIKNQPLENLIEPLEDAYEKLLVADYLEKRNTRRNALQKRVINTIEEQVTQTKTPISTPEVAEMANEAAANTSLNPEIKVLPIPDGPPPMPNQEPEMEEIEKPVEAEKPVSIPKPEPTPVAPENIKPEPEAQKPTAAKPNTSIAEKAQAGHQQKSLHAKFAAQKLSFGLNDRLAYVKHLFGGNTDDFNRVISQLNTMEDWEEADSFINEMVKPDFNWAGKEDYEERFLSHVKTKFD